MFWDEGIELREVIETQKPIGTYNAEVQEDICEYCHKSFPIDELYYGEDPYLSEIVDKHEEVVLCKDCYRDNVEGI